MARIASWQCFSLRPSQLRLASELSSIDASIGARRCNSDTIRIGPSELGVIDIKTCLRLPIIDCFQTASNLINETHFSLSLGDCTARTMPLNHISLATGPANFAAMREFYLDILGPLGYGIYLEKEGEFLGMAPKRGGPDFWLHCGGEDFPKFDGNVEKRGGRMHVAFDASSRKAVDEWYKHAMYVRLSTAQSNMLPVLTRG